MYSREQEQGVRDSVKQTQSRQKKTPKNRPTFRNPEKNNITKKRTHGFAPKTVPKKETPANTQLGE